MLGKKTGRLDFKKLILTESAARGTTKEYEIKKSPEEMLATLYEGNWKYNDDVKREDCQVGQGIWGIREYDSMTEELHRLGIRSWNGFDKYDKRALDGWSFSLEIILSDDAVIKAHGTNSFPKHYSEFKECLNEAVFGPKEY